MTHRRCNSAESNSADFYFLKRHIIKEKWGIVLKLVRDIFEPELLEDTEMKEKMIQKLHFVFWIRTGFD